MQYPKRQLNIESDGDLAALVALSTLPSMTPKRLRQLTLSSQQTTSYITPSKIWSALKSQRRRPPLSHYDLAAGCSSGVANSDMFKANVWKDLCVQAQTCQDPTEIFRSHIEAGIEILTFGGQGYPEALCQDRDPPMVLYKQGHNLENRARVAIVGTRKCSRYGREVTQSIASVLSGADIPIVSGLAEGIDFEAHNSALATNEQCCPVAVVAGGLDHIYPKHNWRLWKQVAQSGTIVSEWPLRVAPKRWSFPARNRLIAALSDAVIVVETKETGGSIHTVTAALDRSKDVYCVPGSVFSPQSKGCNKLISEGANPLFDLSEVIETLSVSFPQTQQEFALEIASGSNPAGCPNAKSRAGCPSAKSRDLAETEQIATGEESWLLKLVGWYPITYDELIKLSDRTTIETVVELEQQIAKNNLVRTGSVIERRGTKS